ncbi:hypothetical protein BGX21_009425 [Mortierella sp. AD011]|nr:hypothetical protein BGX20_010256 [Mortierella sp. AD010]KAF9396706.1 hypothetical protein BGX21_009425 [Mortierella sp. AD011]
MLKLYHKAGVLIYILAFITAFTTKYPKQFSVLMFTLKAALALTVIEVFFADDLSDEQWKLLENSWKVLQMWMVIFVAYLKFTFASSTDKESSDESAQTHTTDDTNNNIDGNNGSNNNNSSSSGTNEQSPLLPSVKSNEPKPAAVDSV